ncbi:hypothetical protein BmHG_00049 [Borrelia miyamotoi]|uniref:DUF3276 family protein n=1 Tax=Borrelia miyamotoi TaxID=47466 RepID=A0AAP9CG21_9SPIR|nr:DUF3276 family protein [Borrelia miyamotoi]ATQ15127.1 DUF3276 family protein [Borrelia miyamotoi]ATQ16309.1 DUF3276 family protein [Borrelia miyamotoi]ATQ17453.1 DUF3276 family protein [Borrelia miyamotoi]ATQ18045.1 DUF3276 family protein [Borrelia miyamotoi]ATQ19949.1 DUF3276 family protein [Borrelia miyamotoi]
MGERGEVYSDKLFTNSDRTYFFNVKENRKGDYFLNIVESKRNMNGDFERHSVFVYEENIEEFESNLLRAISVIKKKISQNSVSRKEYHNDFDRHNENVKGDNLNFDRNDLLSGKPRDRDN